MLLAVDLDSYMVELRLYSNESHSSFLGDT